MLIDVDHITGSLKFNVGATRSNCGTGRRGAGYRVKGNLPAISEKQMRRRDNRSALGQRIQGEQDDKVVALLQELEHTCILKLVDQNQGKPYTLEDVGDILNVTRERVRQIQTKATMKIRTDPGTYKEMQTI